MKRFICSLFLITMVISLAAAPSLDVTSGALHNITALNREGRLTLSMHISGSVKDFPDTYLLSDSSTNTVWDTYGFGTMRFGLSYTFTRWLEISAKGEVLADAIKYESGPERSYAGNYLSYGFGDTDLGVKLTTDGLFGSTEYADIGAYGFYRFNTGDLPGNSYTTASFSNTIYEKKDGGLYRFFTSGSRDYGIIGLASFKTATQVPMLIDLNGGYVKRTIATNVSAANYWRYGASFSAKFGAFVPFVEGYGRKYVASALFEDQYIIYASGGMRFDTPAGLVIDLGSDYRITRFSTSPRPDTVRSNVYNINEGWSAVPDWRFHFGLSYYYDFIKDAAPIVIETKKTLVTGKIVDEENGEPLSAIVTMPGYSKDIRVTTDSTGTYSIEVNPGTIRIRVNREGYKWKEKGIIIEKGQTKIVDFTLVRKEEAKGTLEGKVVNKSDNEPIRATISFPNTDIPNIRSGSSTGKFRIDMEPGTYQMTVSKEGFIEWSQPVEIEQDKTLVMTIELLKKGGRINLVGIHFDSGKATIRPSSYPVLDRAVDMLKENPNVRIEIQGHTDSVGSASNNLSLSQARAESVRSYLINRGISASRIIAKGYGETMPIATNTTRYGRQQNRRIEFLILGD